MNWINEYLIGKWSILIVPILIAVIFIGFAGTAEAALEVVAVEAVDPEPEDGEDTRCYIATAAFGSPFEPSVVLLREFRDQFLLTNALGRGMVNLYYLHSPSLAARIQSDNLFKLATRILLIPVISLAYILLHALPMFFVLLAGLIIAKTRAPFQFRH